MPHMWVRIRFYAPTGAVGVGGWFVGRAFHRGRLQGLVIAA
ncbi:hydantoinase/oxoprolinase [Aspergillus luchuensis]|uniref:Hydantoinase/oxoprolinase n=1 Tax=Aspergillus kawachii TaxID=1069201 RepID=A0A146F9I4_ASPKA|nr:hydantoinase/oxoprolinase [Aspergillus luchuensis]